MQVTQHMLKVYLGGRLISRFFYQSTIFIRVMSGRGMNSGTVSVSILKSLHYITRPP